MLKKKVIIVTSRENIFVMITTQSVFKKPYQIQKLSPTNNTSSMGKEISPAFFSFMILESCGIKEIAVKIPAILPIKYGLTKYKSILTKKKIHTITCFLQNTE
jgi:hypothetical protein